MDTSLQAGRNKLIEAGMSEDSASAVIEVIEQRYKQDIETRLQAINRKAFRWYVVLKISFIVVCLLSGYILFKQ